MEKDLAVCDYCKFQCYRPVYRVGRQDAWKLCPNCGGSATTFVTGGRPPSTERMMCYHCSGHGFVLASSKRKGKPQPERKPLAELLGAFC